MARATIQLTGPVKRSLWHHLLEQDHDAEDAAFLFVRRVASQVHRYAVIDWYAVPSEGFAFRSAYHFDLTDETRALIIKRAHDLDASLVEAHSHLGDRPPAFSPSDLFGFHEFVPHVWWRLKAKPYFALVISEGGVDGLAWIDGPEAPERILALQIDHTSISPSAESPLRWNPDLEWHRR